MKKLVLFLSALVVLASCQRKDYATFQKSSTPNYAVAKKQVEKPVEQKNNVVIESNLTASNSEVIDLKPKDSSTLDLLSEKEIDNVLSQKSEQKFSSEKISVTNKKSTVKSKVAKALLTKKLNSNFKKSTTGINNVEGKINTLSLLSLIFGGVGLLLMFSGIGGILFGIAGFVLGLIALKKGTPNKTMAILGVVFGGVAILVALLAFTLIASLAGV